MPISTTNIIVNQFPDDFSRKTTITSDDKLLVNGSQFIAGQDLLDQAHSSLLGVATTSTVPTATVGYYKVTSATTDQTFTNFLDANGNAIVVPANTNAELIYNGSSWTLNKIEKLGQEDIVNEIDAQKDKVGGVASFDSMATIKNSLLADNTTSLENLTVSSTAGTGSATAIFGNYSYKLSVATLVKSINIPYLHKGASDTTLRYGYLLWDGTKYDQVILGNFDITSYAVGASIAIPINQTLPAGAVVAIALFQRITYSTTNANLGYVYTDSSSQTPAADGTTNYRQLNYTITKSEAIDVKGLKTQSDANAVQTATNTSDVAAIKSTLNSGTPIDTALENLTKTATGATGSGTAIFGNYSYKLSVATLVKSINIPYLHKGTNDTSLRYGYLLWDGTTYVQTILGTLDITDYTDGSSVTIPIGATLPVGAIVALSLFQMFTYSTTNSSVGYVYTASTSQTPLADGTANFRQLNYTITYIPDAITSLNIEVAQLKKDVVTSVSKWKGKKIAFLGDSITEQGRYTNQYSSLTGCSVFNYGKSSTHLAPINSSDTTSFEYRVPTMDATVDMVLVFGGTNDFGHSTVYPWNSWTTTAPWGSFLDYLKTGATSFQAGVHRTFKALYDKYRGKPIVVMLPLHHGYESGTPEYIKNSDGSLTEGTNADTGKTFAEYVAAIRQIAEFYSFIILDAYGESGLNPVFEDSSNRYYFIDGLHPSDIGAARLAKWMYPQLEEVYNQFY